METEPAFASASCTRVFSIQLCWSLVTGCSEVFFQRICVWAGIQRLTILTIYRMWICLSPALPRIIAWGRASWRRKSSQTRPCMEDDRGSQVPVLQSLCGSHWGLSETNVHLHLVWHSMQDRWEDGSLEDHLQGGRVSPESSEHRVEECKLTFSILIHPVTHQTGGA